MSFVATVQHVTFIQGMGSYQTRRGKVTFIQERKGVNFPHVADIAYCYWCVRQVMVVAEMNVAWEDQEVPLFSPYCSVYFSQYKLPWSGATRVPLSWLKLQSHSIAEGM